ncbi:MAG: hypothetical protein M1834_004920 [Cirrosporium novae-zelandiae]|nr:MAG: hypothetical protein M1834_004920 [Cirrosporium novae-zelandiae]
MQNSSYFHRSFTYDQNPAAAKVFFQRSSKLFEKSQENSSIEVLASNRVTSAYERTPPEIHRGDEDSDDSTDPKSINGQDHPGHENSPAHVGEPSLSPYHVSNAGDLEKLARKTKPNFRIFFLPQKHAYSRLQVTKDLYDALLKACHVFPRFNECICYLGVKFSEDEIGPPLLKYRSLENENGTFRGFECAYVLRFVEFTNRPGKEPWDLQQTVIYNRYKPPGKNACSTWILVDASKQVRAVLDRYTRQFITPALSNPFEIHLLFLDMALTNWRPYMVDLTKRITDLASILAKFQQATYELISNRVLVVSSEDSASETICFDDRLKLAKIEDRLIDMLLVLESSAETISILSERYQQINESLINHSTGINSRKCDTIVAVFREKAQEVSYAHKRADALLSKSRGTMKLSGNALKILGEESRSENTAMRQLAEKSTRDASAVKVLTIITLIYLPSTVVGVIRLTGVEELLLDTVCGPINLVRRFFADGNIFKRRLAFLRNIRSINSNYVGIVVGVCKSYSTRRVDGGAYGCCLAAYHKEKLKITVARINGPGTRE